MATTNINPAINPAPAQAANPAGNAGSPANEVKSAAAGKDAQMPATPSQLDNLRGMMSQRHPDANYENDDDFYAAIADDYATRDKDLDEYKGREERMANLFTRDQRSRQFMDDWIEGGDPVVALMRRYGDDFKAALEDPDKLEELAAANKEWVDALAKEKELEEEYQANLQQTYEDIDKYQQESGLSDEQIDQAMEYLRQSAANIIMGKYTPELIDAAIKAQNYDADIANAGYEGEVRGKNTRAEMQLRKPKQSDGMPQLGSRSGGNAPQRPQIPGALGREKKSIWDAGGGMKRSTRS